MLSKGAVSLKPISFKKTWQNESAIVLDVRDLNKYSMNYIPGSVLMSYGPSFTKWLGKIVTDMRCPILLVTDSSQSSHEIIVQLSSVGYHNVLGCLDGGVEAWAEQGFETKMIHQITTVEYLEMAKSNRKTILLETDQSTVAPIKNSIPIDLHSLTTQLKKLKPASKIYVGGSDRYISTLAFSLGECSGHDCVSIVVKT